MNGEGGGKINVRRTCLFCDGGGGFVVSSLIFGTCQSLSFFPHLVIFFPIFFVRAEVHLESVDCARGKVCLREKRETEKAFSYTLRPSGRVFFA